LNHLNHEEQPIDFILPFGNNFGFR
jgi:hypothetical protein